MTLAALKGFNRSGRVLFTQATALGAATSFLDTAGTALRPQGAPNGRSHHIVSGVAYFTMLVNSTATTNGIRFELLKTDNAGVIQEVLMDFTFRVATVGAGLSPTIGPQYVPFATNMGRDLEEVRYRLNIDTGVIGDLTFRGGATVHVLEV